ncbi:MAG: endonuclease III [Zavarzinella sp.]
MKKRKPTAKKLEQAERVRQELIRLYPDAYCELNHANPLQLLVATILSAQCTDVRVNMVTPALFEKYPDAAAFAGAEITELEALIASTGFYHNKAKNIIACCKILHEQHAGEVPTDLETLVQLPGVGRKTANVVRGDAFGLPGITVDTHVGRLSVRLGLTKEEDPVKVEFELMDLIPEEDWTTFSHRLIFHGRRVCNARKPACEQCTMSEFCPSSNQRDTKAVRKG